MYSVNVRCFLCDKEFIKTWHRYKESEKRNWKHLCSLECYIKVRQKGKIVTCDNPFCRKEFYKKKNQLNKSVRNFCSQSCSATLRNLEKGLRGQKKCTNPNCGNSVPSYRKFCTRQCYLSCLNNKELSKNFLSNKPISKKIYAKRVVKHLKRFTKQNGRIPFKREVNYLYRPARIAFGTWNNAIKAAGFTPNKLKFTKKYKASDGHICDSLAEKIIDDWLFTRNINHKINHPYPFDNGFTVDFKVGDYWIEFFGLSGQHQKYDRLKIQKLSLVKKHKLNLIKIHPKDLFPNFQLDKILNFLLEK